MTNPRFVCSCGDVTAELTSGLVAKSTDDRDRRSSPLIGARPIYYTGLESLNETRDFVMKVLM